MQWQFALRPFAPSTPNEDGARTMNLGWLLFSFNGRINRMWYWLSWIGFVPLAFMAMAIATNKEIHDSLEEQLLIAPAC